MIASWLTATVRWSLLYHRAVHRPVLLPRSHRASDSPDQCDHLYFVPDSPLFLRPRSPPTTSTADYPSKPSPRNSTNIPSNSSSSSSNNHSLIPGIMRKKNVSHHTPFPNSSPAPDSRDTSSRPQTQTSITTMTPRSMVTAITSQRLPRQPSRIFKHPF